VDGSLLNAYFFKQWEVSTRKMAFAEGIPPYGGDVSFRQLFEQRLGGTVDKVFKKLKLPIDVTYSFEFVSPITRVVTRYTEPDIYLLNIRHRKVGSDFPKCIVDEYAKKLGVKRPKIYSFDTIENIVESMKELPALEEGYVLYWSLKQWRIKVKNPSYLAIAHLRQDGVISEKRVVFLVLAQDYEEYLGHFSEDRQIFQPFIDAYYYMIKYVDDLWNKTKDIENRKDFALAVRGPGQSLLFGLKDGKSIDQTINGMDGKRGMLPNAKVRLLKSFM